MNVVVCHMLTCLHVCIMLRFFYCYEIDNFKMKKKIYFSYFCSMHILWVHVRIPTEVVLTSTHSLLKSKNKKIMYTPVNPILPYKSGVYRHVSMMLVF